MSTFNPISWSQRAVLLALLPRGSKQLLSPKPTELENEKDTRKHSGKVGKAHICNSGQTWLSSFQWFTLLLGALMPLLCYT